MRHLWGDTQYELHPEAQELFLDLIFVGVAFRIGSVVKISFYACEPTIAGNSSIDASGGGGAAGGHGSDGAALYPCIGLGLGVWHALAPFVCMYLLWQIETSYRARFAAWSKLHAFSQLVSNMLLLLAAMNISPVGVRASELPPPSPNSQTRAVTPGGRKGMEGG